MIFFNEFRADSHPQEQIGEIITIQGPDVVHDRPEGLSVTCVCGRQHFVRRVGIGRCDCDAFLAWYWHMDSDSWVVMGFCTLEGKNAYFVAGRELC